MTNKQESRGTGPDRQSPAMIGALGIGFLGYFIAEIALTGRPHPLHWLTAALAGLLGYGGGHLWPTYREWSATRSHPAPRRKPK